MITHNIGIIMNGVTGRMGTNQHLMRSIVAIREQGGVKLADGGKVMPEPVLVGRSAAKLEALAREAGGARWTTDLESALAGVTQWTHPAVAGLNRCCAIGDQIGNRCGNRGLTSDPENHAAD